MLQFCSFIKNGRRRGGGGGGGGGRAAADERRQASGSGPQAGQRGGGGRQREAAGGNHGAWSGAATTLLSACLLVPLHVGGLGRVPGSLSAWSPFRCPDPQNCKVGHRDGFHSREPKKLKVGRSDTVYPIVQLSADTGPNRSV